MEEIQLTGPKVSRMICPSLKDGSERECVFRAEVIKCTLVVEEDALFR